MKRYLTENYMHIFLDKRVISFVAGLTGGAVAGVFTQPFDVVKTRRQVFDYSGDKGMIEFESFVTELDIRDTCVSQF